MNPLADVRIALARRSSLFPRSSALMRSRSLVVTPARAPLLIAWRLSHLSNVQAVHPIFGVIVEFKTYCSLSVCGGNLRLMAATMPV